MSAEELLLQQQHQNQIQEGSRLLLQESSIVVTSLRKSSLAHGFSLINNFELLRHSLRSLFLSTTTTESHHRWDVKSTNGNDEQDFEEECSVNDNNNNLVGLIHPFLQPFIAVVVDSQTSGRHTLVALR